MDRPHDGSDSLPVGSLNGQGGGRPLGHKVPLELGQHGQQTYGEMTIAKALETVTRQYKPGKRRQGVKHSGGAGSGTLSGEPPPGTIDPATGRSMRSA
jgi:hypothetical protein